jgi:predicted glycogen debranching enzyme
MSSDMALERDALGSFDATSRREWLVTNGIGGFAAGTLGLVNTRRYHALLIAALRPPVDRVALVAKLDVTAIYGGRPVPLGTNEFADGTIAPRGFCRLESFRLEGLIPVWTWLIADARLEQRIWMRYGENTTYVQFTRRGGSKALRLSFEPLCAYRDYHWQSRGERPFGVEPIPGGVRIQAHDGAQPFRISSEGADVAIQPQWYWNFRHREESARGLDDLEDLLRPARFELDIGRDQSKAVTLSAEINEPMPAHAAWSAEVARQQEIADRFTQLHPARIPGTERLSIDRLVLAADQFLVERRDFSGKPLGKTVIAGYPWFSDWGRDTMIALPGLTLATGRSDIAASVLRTFARFVNQGMLPNRFPDAGDAPEYNTVDASLWYFVAVYEYLRATHDSAFASEIYPTLKDMLGWHVRGTRFGIHMDPTDDLLWAGEPGVQLTWMDAKVGDWVVTPRIGKPVEINALWFNAVSVLRDLAAELGHGADHLEFAALAGRIHASFERTFWFEAGGYLYDVIDGPEGEADEAGRRRDGSLRPNQILAISLPHPLLRGAKARSVLDVCTAELWTPVGLRSLAAGDGRYVGRYGGGPIERDGAYHQGTIWTWLLGPFVAAHYRVNADAAAALDMMRGISAHLREACVGQVSEIMDADPPFEARGCFAQAWGVAEILRVWSEINESENRRHSGHDNIESAAARAGEGSAGER